ncbi:MAG TPA: FtsX-like permease family protein [Acidimicrobiales bacterium]
MLNVTIKGLLAHKFRLAATALAVLLGVAFMAGTLVLTATIGATFDGLYADINAGTDVQVRSAQAVEGPVGDVRGPVDESVLPTVQGVDGVRVAEGGVGGYAQFVGKDGKAVGNPSQGAPTLGFSWGDDEALSPLRLASGSPPSGPDEVVADKATADKEGFALGDQVTVLTQSGSKQFTLSGITRFGNVDSPLGATLAIFELSTAQELFGFPDKFSQIAVAADEGISQQELADRITEVLPEGLEAVTGEDLTEEQQSQTREFLGFFNTFLTAFAVIALFVGVFLIYNTFSIIVAQRTKEMALLRALGASRRQVLTSVMVEAFVTGVVASVVGVVIGFGVAIVLRSALAGLGFDIPAEGLTIEPNAVVIPFLIGVVITVLSALFPARKASRIPPVAAMRDIAVDDSGQSVARIVAGAIITLLGLALTALGLFGSSDNGLAAVGGGLAVTFLGVAVLGPIIAPPVAAVVGTPMGWIRGISGHLARENAMRNPKRTSATAAALMIGVGVVACIIVLAATITTSVRGTVDKGFVGDFVVQSNAGFQGGLSPEVASALDQQPDLAIVAEFRSAPAQVNGSGTLVPAVDPTAFSQLADLEVIQGSLSDLEPAGTVAVSEDKLDDENWALGDTVEVIFPDTGPQQLKIVATYDKPELLGPGGSPYLIGLSTYDANSQVQLDSSVFVKLASGVSLEQGRAAIESVTDAYPNADVQTKQEFADAIVGQITQLVVLVYALLGLAIIIALIGIVNTLALSIFERTRELGLLRAVGMSRSQLRTSVRYEAVIIALLGTFLGLVLGLVFGVALVVALGDNGSADLTIPVSQLVVVVILAIIAGALSAILPARRASRLNILHAIQTE